MITDLFINKRRAVKMPLSQTVTLLRNVNVKNQNKTKFMNNPS